jgi:hypothetical protein
MSRNEYENSIDQAMFILGLKRDPKFETSLHAIAHGSDPGITDALDQLAAYGFGARQNLPTRTFQN